MKKTLSMITLCVMFFLMTANIVLAVSENTSIPYTIADRDRLTRVETKLDEGLKAVNQRIDSLDKRIDSLQNLMYIMLGGIFGLIGFVVWGRKMGMLPLSNKVDKLIKILAEDNPKIKTAGLL